MNNKTVENDLKILRRVQAPADFTARIMQRVENLKSEQSFSTEISSLFRNAIVAGALILCSIAILDATSSKTISVNENAIQGINSYAAVNADIPEKIITSLIG